jgi:CxxC motif-containing protein
MSLNEETKKFLCVSCPVGCLLKVTVRAKEVLSVADNGCPLGVKYAQNEVVNPVRTFTSTVRVSGASLPVCPVRSRTPLPLSKVGDVTRELATTEATAPISIGQVIIKDICGTGIDIIASRSLEKS